MKSHTTEFAEFLASNNKFVVCDLYTFELQIPYWDGINGVQFDPFFARYTSFDQDVWHEGELYSATSALIERTSVRANVGVEVDKLNLRIYANDDMYLRGQPFMQAITAGELDSATLKLDRLYMDVDLVPQGTVNMFSGRVATVRTGRSVAEIEVNSDLELLNINMPRKLYQAGCQNTLYDVNCGVYAAQFSETLTVGSGSTKTTLYISSSKPLGYFDLGGIIFNTGENANALRTIKSWDGTKLELVNPLPSTPILGETFYAFAGCDKKKDTCVAKFDNVIHFRGFPYIPQPETMR